MTVDSQLHMGQALIQGIDLPCTGSEPLVYLSTLVYYDGIKSFQMEDPNNKSVWFVQCLEDDDDFSSIDWVAANISSSMCEQVMNGDFAFRNIFTNPENSPEAYGVYYSSLYFDDITGDRFWASRQIQTTDLKEKDLPAKDFFWRK